MAQQVQHVFRTVASKVGSSGRAMSTGASGTLEGPKSAAKTGASGLHVTAQRSYPLAAALPLPPNIDPAETSRFSPLRARDINATAILTHQSSYLANHIDVTVDSSAGASADPHVESYDCRGAVSLNSTMQSTVPTPFGGMHKFSHLNMPGGAWAQENKFVSHDLQSAHYMNLRHEVRSSWSEYEDKPLKKVGTLVGVRPFSLCSSALAAANNPGPKATVTEEPAAPETVSRKDRLKKAVKEYGSTVIVFHVGISLASLGTCYLLVSSGIDVVSVLERLGWGDSALATKAGAGAGTFVIAYAIHKVFAPVRISITLGSTPFIVRYLRNRGILKPPAPVAEKKTKSAES